MKIGILGSGDVGQSLANGFIALGHEVKIASREAGNEKLLAWAASKGELASTGTFSEAADFADIVVLATNGLATVDAINLVGPSRFEGKVVIDATNPLSWNAAAGRLELEGGKGTSGGENNAAALPGAFVVKAFNTVGLQLFFRPDFGGVLPTMFICGDDESAKAKVSEIVTDFGWEPLDVGGIAASHYLEATAVVWIWNSMKNHNALYSYSAFKMLKK